jgi:hypothetical protein
MMVAVQARRVEPHGAQVIDEDIDELTSLPQVIHFFNGLSLATCEELL